MLKNRPKVICAQRTRTSVVTVVALACALGAWGAEPLSWERTPNRPAPAQFDTFHGESLDFRCTFTGFGSLPFAPGAISGSGASAPRLYYQTNGMGAAWWSIPAAVSYTVITNCQPTTNQPANQHTNYQLSATFPPSADPGAERLTVFFGAPSNAYAAAQVRFRNSPGAHPNDLDPPSALDWQAELAAATNALWESSAAAFMPQSNAYTKSETDARIAELAPRTSLEPATNYTDVATNALRKSLALITTNDVRAIVTASGNWEWTGPGTYIASASERPAEGSVEGEKYFTVSNIAWGDDTPGSEHWDAFITIWQWGEEADEWGWLEMSGIGQAFGYGKDADVIEFDVLDYIFIGRKYNALGLARLSDLAAATNSLHKSFAPTISNTVTKAYVEDLGIIATNNPAFVAAVTNCPVAIAASDAEALTEWGIYGGGGTIGALLAALAAAVAALKKKKMPLYPVGGTGNPVNATIESGVLTVSPFSMAAYTPTASAAFSVAMGALPSDMEAGKARDAVLVIDCSSLTEGQEPTVTWDTHFHPRTDAGTDFACEAGVRNVYYISEYASGEFAVGGWVETAGGNA